MCSIKKGALKKFAKLTKKTPVWGSLIFNEASGLRPTTS